MAKVKKVTTLVERMERNIPQLSFTASYEANDAMLLASMRAYKNRAFVYVLMVDCEDREECIYVGRSMYQYGRMLQHLENFYFTRVYLFECDEMNLDEAEVNAIRMLEPLFNRRHNPKAFRYQRVLDLDYDGVYDEETTLHYLNSWKQYCTCGMYGFALPPILYTLLKETASIRNRTVSSELTELFEALFAGEIAGYIDAGVEYPMTNLATTNAFGCLHEKSCEQVKQYLHQEDRLVGQKIGRDWITIDDEAWPEDRREKGTAH